MLQSAVGRLIGNAVRKARQERGISQADLALATGLSRRHLAMVESGGNATVLALVRIARALPNLPLAETFAAAIRQNPPKAPAE